MIEVTDAREDNVRRTAECVCAAGRLRLDIQSPIDI
jgi:hypothetical protein